MPTHLCNVAIRARHVDHQVLEVVGGQAWGRRGVHCAARAAFSGPALELLQHTLQPGWENSCNEQSALLNCDPVLPHSTAVIV